MFARTLAVVHGQVLACSFVCVWTIWRDVKLLSFAGGPGALGWHGPTKTHPSCCANVPAIFESWWGVANPKTIMPFFNENHIRIFEFSTWTDEGDFSFIFLHRWHNLRLKWISCPLQFSAYLGILPGFYWFYSILQGGDERIFLSLHTKHPPVPVRCNWIVFARQMHSTTEFAMTVLSKCVTHAGFVKVGWTLRGIPF